MANLRILRTIGDYIMSLKNNLLDIKHVMVILTITATGIIFTMCDKDKPVEQPKPDPQAEIDAYNASLCDERANQNPNYDFNFVPGRPRGHGCDSLPIEDTTPPQVTKKNFDLKYRPRGATSSCGGVVLGQDTLRSIFALQDVDSVIASLNASIQNGLNEGGLGRFADTVDVLRNVFKKLKFKQGDTLRVVFPLEGSENAIQKLGNHGIPVRTTYVPGDKSTSANTITIEEQIADQIINEMLAYVGGDQSKKGKNKNIAKTSGGNC